LFGIAMTDISYHNHSRFSDGADSVDAMVQAAKAAGLAEFGLSDHWVFAPFRNPEAKTWSMAQEQLDKYVQEVCQARQKYCDDSFQLRLGIEVDFFPENAAQVVAALGDQPFDYIIGAVHYVDRFAVDHSAETWAPFTQAQVDDIWRQYWQRIRGLARSGLYDIVAHLDLPKKFAFYPSVELRDEEDAALAAIREADMIIEINTAGLDKPCDEPYPSLSLLQRARALDIPVIVSADAHRCANVKRNFPAAYELMARAGYDPDIRWHFKQRRREAGRNA
jgi:histidinol-phosphatase (PHP family)